MPNEENANRLLLDCRSWDELGALLGLPVKTMAYALTFRAEMQHRIRIKKRTVFESMGALLCVQRRLAMLLTDMFEHMDDTEAAIAYRKGQCPQQIIGRYAGRDWVMTTDIRKYYDHVTFDLIKAALIRLGMSKRMAHLVSRYCIVKNDLHLIALQQGSPASPVLSNIVGHFAFDVPIREKLNELERQYGLEIGYLRYSDNIGLFVNGPQSEPIREAVRRVITDVAAASGMQTHDWRFMGQDAPDRAQTFLGIVLNKRAGVAREYLRRYAAALFKLCRKGPKLCWETGSLHADGPLSMHKKLIRLFTGVAAYVGMINEAQGLKLKKLVTAYKLTWTADGDTSHDRIYAVVDVTRDEYVRTLRQYGTSVTLETYVRHMKDTIKQLSS